MRVLCCLDGTNVREVSKATEMLSTAQSTTLALLFITDTGPRHEIEHMRERFHRHPGPPPPREEEMRQAEKVSAEDILDEGRRDIPSRFGEPETLHKIGRPEREIVNTAAEWQADVVIICPRPEYGGKHAIGPKSVGHVARFVLDHSPCPVLLVRALAREHFPIPREK
ncbi:MAG: universal stress protein [Verrucomicrobia bacterium]|nr:universal stress protein [Verrucomicrobiota bacterium]